VRQEAEIAVNNELARLFTIPLSDANSARTP
jgi:hypothetical protein